MSKTHVAVLLVKNNLNVGSLEFGQDQVFTRRKNLCGAMFHLTKLCQ